MAKKDCVSLKLSESNTIRLLQLYQGEPCLYDVNTDDYRNRELRTAALKRIAAALSVDDFGPKEVAVKFKNLRNSYSQELKKVKDSEVSGASEDDIYVPKVYWFSVMDSFLRPYLYSRPTQTNLVLKQKILTKKTNSEHPEDEDEDSRISTLEDQPEIEDVPYHTNNQGADREVISDIRENSVKPPVSKFGGIKRKRYIPPQKATASKSSSNQSAILTAVNKLNEVSKLAAYMVSQKQDIYSYFGDYVASVLREIGGQTAMLMQHEISDVIFKYMTGLSPYPSAPSHVSSASNPSSPYESSSHESVVGQSMHEETQQDNEQLD